MVTVDVGARPVTDVNQLHSLFVKHLLESWSILVSSDACGVQVYLCIYLCKKRDDPIPSHLR